MSQNNFQFQHHGVTATEMLTILFIGLKLTYYVDWSWWWVFSPIWISFLVGLFLTGLVMLGVGLSNKSGR